MATSVEFWANYTSTDLNKYGLRLTQLQVKQASRHLTLSVVTMTSQ